MLRRDTIRTVQIGLSGSAVLSYRLFYPGVQGKASRHNS